MNRSPPRCRSQESDAISRIAFIKAFALAALLVSGCATESASKAEVAQLKAELRSQRDANSRLAERLSRLENAQAVVAGRELARAKDASVPDLSVVKLKPKTEPAPKIDTHVAVSEPSPDVVDDFDTKAIAPELEADEQPPQDPAVADAMFEDGMNALKTGNIDGGVQKLLVFASQFPRHQKADNALYFAGVGAMGLNDYEGASNHFAQVIDSYPAGDALVDSMLKLADCRARQNQKSDAKALYSKVVQSYPGTPAASQAQARLLALH